MVSSQVDGCCLTLHPQLAHDPFFGKIRRASLSLSLWIHTHTHKPLCGCEHRIQAFLSAGTGGPH